MNIIDGGFEYPSWWKITTDKGVHVLESVSYAKGISDSKYIFLTDRFICVIINNKKIY
jgi:hypothetical protein